MMKLMLQQEPGISREQLQQQIQNAARDAQRAAEEAARAAGHPVQGRNGIVVPAPPAVPGIPGTISNQYPENVIPPQVETISISFFIMIAAIVIGWPLMRAFARRIERGTPVAAPLPREVTEQLQHITQSVDAIAIEVERISEGQRFTTKMLADRNADGTVIAPANPPR
jgi:hypothetical protein